MHLDGIDNVTVDDTIHQVDGELINYVDDPYEAFLDPFPSEAPAATVVAAPFSAARFAHDKLAG